VRPATLAVAWTMAHPAVTAPTPAPATDRIETLKSTWT
jgi:aryl-alcohol dehydrogenase-like predicted oxidoreductase